jgi:ribosomal protein S18 acetylase RimI-like enzyme
MDAVRGDPYPRVPRPWSTESGVPSPPSPPSSWPPRERASFRGDTLSAMSQSQHALPVEIRDARATDVDAVLRVWDRSGAHGTVTDDAAGVSLLIEQAPGALLVAVDSTVIVGTVVAGWNGWRGSIYRLAVASSHRRRGVATALLISATERLSALGARRIDAFVVKDDELARSFWDSMSSPWGPDPLEKLRFVRQR